MNKEEFIEQLKQNGIFADKSKVDEMFAFMEKTLEINEFFNLTALKYREDFIEKMLFDSALANLGIDYKDKEIIDVGTGSGILGIDAALLGAGHVLAVDIDQDAVKVAAENVANNHVQEIVTVQQGNLLEKVDAVCDICVANIISDVIISFAAPLMSHIRPGGLFICSGIVSLRGDEVAQALMGAGYEILQKYTRGEWTAFLSRRNA